MQITVRQETPKDQAKVFALIQEAFESVVISDHQEHHLVNRLRKSEAFIAELSLVAAKDGNIVGHILLTKLNIRDSEVVHNSLALAPISVLPACQGQGIGSLLIERAHEVAIQLGYQSIVLIGHEDYYPRFGYEPAHEYGILFPFEVPQKNALAKELIPNALQDVNGIVTYPKEFFE